MASASAIALNTPETTLDCLAEKIKEAIISTQAEDASDKFLPNDELIKILNNDSLTRLFNELCAKTPMRCQSGASGRRSDSVVGPHTPEQLVIKVRNEPARLSLLALFIYDERHRCLDLLMDCLRSTTPSSFPSDDDLPLDRTRARRIFHRGDVEWVLDHQAIFTPFIIREDEHRVLNRKRSRPPFIGKRERLGEGSSGAVYKVTIAAGHYEYKRNNRYVLENHEYTVAMKVFHETHQVSAESAAEDYEVERDFLDQLKMDTKLHKMILLDLGGVVEMDGPKVLRQSLLFELALCDLDRFFKSEDYKHQYAEQGSILIAKAMNLLDALDFLHKTFKSLHMDIKPDNILVFNNPERENDINWKLSDFSLSRKKLVRSPVGSYEISNLESRRSVVPSARSAGIYQAPEIQVRDKSPASEGSDVWSMGCLIITLLAFVRSDGIHQVQKLDEMLDVYTSDTPVERRLFYVTNAMLQWQDLPRTAEKLNIRTEKGRIGPNMEAMLHPRLIEWLDYLYISSETDVEQETFALAARIILKSVLVIDRKKRITASEFRSKLQEVHDMYESLNSTQPQSRNTQLASAPRPPTVHSRLCEAIRRSERDTIKILVSTPGESSKPCPRRDCGEYPLHQILRHRDLPALQEVLSTLKTTDVLQRSKITKQTPLQIACEGDGDEKALQLLFNRFSDELEISKDILKSARCTQRAARILKEWHRKSEERLKLVRSGSTSDTHRSSGSFFSFRSRRTNDERHS